MNSTTIPNKTTKHPHYYMFLFMTQSEYLQEMYFFSGLFSFLLSYSFLFKIIVNAGLYHYAGNNPIRYMDPDGRTDDENETGGMDTGVYIINGHKKTVLEMIDDEISRFAYRNIIEGGAYNADGSGDKWIRTMRGDMITLSRSGEKYFSNIKSVDELARKAPSLGITP